MIKLSRMFLFFLLFFSPCVFANASLRYEPAVVDLIGRIQIQNLPGAPNYQDVNKGDASERVVFLKLEKMIDVGVASKKDKMNEPEKDVDIVQLVSDQPNDLDKLQEGSRARVTGSLFHQQTGHHHTKVLIEVKDLEDCGAKSCLRNIHQYIAWVLRQIRQS